MEEDQGEKVVIQSRKQQHVNAAQRGDNKE
jgi:hypothetical protein